MPPMLSMLIILAICIALFCYRISTDPKVSFCYYEISEAAQRTNIRIKKKEYRQLFKSMIKDDAKLQDKSITAQYISNPYNVSFIKFQVRHETYVDEYYLRGTHLLYQRYSNVTDTTTDLLHPGECDLYLVPDKYFTQWKKHYHDYLEIFNRQPASRKPRKAQL